VEATKQSSQVSKGRGVLTEVAEVLLLALGLYLVINFAIQTVHVIGSSMYPTVSDNDYLIATKIDYRLHPPARGDIIIMRDPYDSSRDFIKRVIGVPGDRILIRQGQVFVNGHLLRETYLNSEAWTENADWPLGQTTDPLGVLLKPNEYFVMGDNRNHSRASIWARLRTRQTRPDRGAGLDPRHPRQPAGTRGHEQAGDHQHDAAARGRLTTRGDRNAARGAAVRLRRQSGTGRRTRRVR